MRNDKEEKMEKQNNKKSEIICAVSFSVSNFPVYAFTVTDSLLLWLCVLYRGFSMDFVWFIFTGICSNLEK